MATINVNSTGLPSQLQQILQADDVQPGSPISYQLCKLLWEYHPLAGKIIEKPVRLALGKPRKLNIPCAIEDQLIEAFEREWDQLGATNHIRDVMYLSRVYGAASIIYGSPDIPTDVAIDPWKLAEIEDLYFNQLDPLNLAGSIVTNQNPNAPDFQKPLQNITAAGQPYHRSRSCTVFCGTPIYLSFQGSSYSFSGRSLFLRALYPLKSFIQTMTVDDLVSLKAGLLIAKIQQPGSIVNRLMSQAAGSKRQLLQEAVNGNVLSIQPEESIESINLNNTDKAMTVARENIISNIAAASDVPAILLKDEAFTSGFGEGKEDSKAVAQYIDGIRQDMNMLFAYFDNIVMHRAWNIELYEGLASSFPEEIGSMSYEQFFYSAKALFKPEWPSLLEEPQSEVIRRDSEKLKAMTDVVKTLTPMLDPENKARAVQWFTDNVNGMVDLFASPMEFDMEALANYEPPNPMGTNEAIQETSTATDSIKSFNDAEWRESDHPRGQPGNAGQFGSGGGGKGGSEKLEKPAEAKPEKLKPVEPKKAKAKTKTVNGRTYTERKPGQSLREYLTQDIDSMPNVKTLAKDPAGFFNLKPDTIMAKLSQLVSIKSTEENTQSGENAKKRMQAAFDGIVSKRDPVKVRPVGTHRYEITNDPNDLEFEIVDGNGTVAALSESGWDSIPVEIGDSYLTPQKQAERHAERVEKSSNVGAYKGDDRAMSADETRSKLVTLYKNAAKAKPKFDKAMKDIGEEFGLPSKNVMLAPLKGSNRAIEKVELEEKGDANSLKDVVRGTLLFKDYKHIEAAMQQMKKLGVEVGKTRNGLMPGSAPQSPDHYRDVKFNVVIDGVPTEVQMNYPEMLEAKEGEGHKLYEEARTIQGKINGENRDPTSDEKKQLNALNKKQQDVYDEAWEKVMARIGKTDE